MRRNLIQIWLLCAAILQALTSGAQPVTKIAAGGYDSLLLKSGNSLWAMGTNSFGQSGDGTYNATNFPEQIVTSNVTAIAQGFSHSLFLMSDGSLWAMGRDLSGQLGDGSFNNTNQPELILTSNITAIAVGANHSLFLKSDGSLWGMGSSGDGQLGDGTYNYTNRPEQIVASNVTAIAAGVEHSLFLKSDGSLWAMGWDFYGQLGDGGYPVTVIHPEWIVASNVTAIAAGYEHSLFLKCDGSLWAMGGNESGQLGDGSPFSYLNVNHPEQIMASNVTTIAAGAYHSLFLKNDGSLWVMGDNSFGQLGDGTTDSGNYYTNRPEMIAASNVTAIAAGYYHSLFLTSDGSLWGMGENDSGELGDGTYNNTNRPELIVVPMAYNQIRYQLLSGTNMQLSFVGMAGKKYALDRSSSLSPANWIPKVIKIAGAGGALVFTNPPDATTNNFWRIRSVP